MKNSLKIVTISDTHGLHYDLKIPKGDILIHAGDFSNVGTLLDCQSFIHWFTKQPHKYKIFIAGNHDFLPQENPTLFKELLSYNPSIIYLQDSFTTIEGIKIYGTPWSLEFYDWAFMLEEEVIHVKWGKIPIDTDILITHSPPKGYLDEVWKAGMPWHIGCQSLTEAIERVKPRIHVFGHMHDGYGTLNYKGIKLINASICTESYDPINKPIVHKYKIK